MSQHKFQHNKMEILYGYEYVFDGFFLVITRDRGYSPVFSNLNLRNPAMTIFQIESILKEYNIPIPENLEEVLTTDRNAGE